MLYDLRINYMKKPIGVDEKPRFSWKIKSNLSNVMQTAYQVEVFENNEIVWDSGKILEDKSVQINYLGKELTPHTEYKVTIKVWDNVGNLYTENTSFETGLLKQVNWNGEWITYENPSDIKTCPVFSKRILKTKDIKKIRLYATACGVYDVRFNGKRVSDTFLAPGWTSYHNRLQYQTYDLNPFLIDEEEQSLEITLGNGWYKGYLNGEGEKEFYGDQLALLAMVFVEYQDGYKELIGTDETWNVMSSFIIDSEIYHGETQVLNNEISTYGNAQKIDVSDKVNKIVAQESEPVKITKKIEAKELIITQKGEVVIDFGQNLSGFVEIKLPEIVGNQLVNEIIIYHAEALDKEGNFYTTNLRTAKATDRYTYKKNSVNSIVHPYFTFHGFRYIKIEGLGSNIDKSRFKACAIHTDMKETGNFICDNEQINQLQNNIEWGQRSNFVDIPSDCPQRDERLGWTGDAQIFASTASYLFDSYRFYQKWMRDVAVESDEEHGVPHIVPNIVGPSVGTAVWSDAATIIPWQLYMSYGDENILIENYDLMKLWVEYINNQSGDSILWMNGFQRGDWLALDAPMSRPSLMSGGTDKNLVANVYYAESTRILRDAAKILGNKEDFEKYSDLFNNIVEEINEEFVTKRGRLVSETQTACVLLLHFNLLKEEFKDRVIQTLEENLTHHKNHLTTGFVGTAFICQALTDNNKHYLAEELFLQQDYPGWFYAVNKGATTIWERWNSILPNGDFDESGMNSLNHYSYGAIGDWMYKKVAGINPLEAGYKKVLIKPYLTHTMTEVKASFESVYGKIRSEWSCKDGKISILVELPANTTGIVVLPEKDEAIEIGSGVHAFDYETTTSLLQNKYTKNTTFAELFDNELLKEVLYEVMPDMKDNPMIGFLRGKTIGELMMMNSDSIPLLEKLLNELNR